MQAPSVVVSDRDGHALRLGFLSTFDLATDQGSKLGLSKNQSGSIQSLLLVVSFIAGSYLENEAATLYYK
ncbi:unnamed protein product [Nyctereutes procyonoides]|uniref:(raccoon dog) hypothetical protein n=1 Tax=Nyctereutes procyonoides TaxID=34880 RepID=A0A811ZCE5_NYCPR|nr:unnamed protein product [Nyctereutes procyonoides]